MKKIIPFTILAIIFSMLLILSASATVSCNLTVPLSNGVIGNLSQFNVTYNVTTDGTTSNASVSIFAYSASTRNSSSTVALVNGTNTTAFRFFNYTFENTNILEDSNDYSVYATVRLNQSGTTAADMSCTTATATNVVFDRTAPATPGAITFPNPILAGNTITATIDRTLANRCFVRFGGTGVERNAMTLTGSTCSFTVQSNSPANSDYQAFIEADDRTNSTFSTAQNMIVRATLSDGGGLFSGTTASFKSGSGAQSILGRNSNPFTNKKGFESVPKLAWVIIGFLIIINLYKKK